MVLMTIASGRENDRKSKMFWVVTEEGKPISFGQPSLWRDFLLVPAVSLGQEVKGNLPDEIKHSQGSQPFPYFHPKRFGFTYLEFGSKNIALKTRSSNSTNGRTASTRWSSQLMLPFPSLTRAPSALLKISHPPVQICSAVMWKNQS